MGQNLDAHFIQEVDKVYLTNDKDELASVNIAMLDSHSRSVTDPTSQLHWVASETMIQFKFMKKGTLNHSTG